MLQEQSIYNSFNASIVNVYLPPSHVLQVSLSNAYDLEKRLFLVFHLYADCAQYVRRFQVISTSSSFGIMLGKERGKANH